MVALIIFWVVTIAYQIVNIVESMRIIQATYPIARAFGSVDLTYFTAGHFDIKRKQSDGRIKLKK